jgi:hypothetical protein
MTRTSEFGTSRRWSVVGFRRVADVGRGTSVGEDAPHEHTCRWLRPDPPRVSWKMGCCDLLAGPHEQGIGVIGTMTGPMPPMVPMADEAASEGGQRPERNSPLL